MPAAMPTEWVEWVGWKAWTCNSRSELPLSEGQSPAPAGLFVSGYRRTLRRLLSRSGYEGLDDLMHCLLASRGLSREPSENALDYPIGVRGISA